MHLHPSVVVKMHQNIHVCIFLDYFNYSVHAQSTFTDISFSNGPQTSAYAGKKLGKEAEYVQKMAAILILYCVGGMSAYALTSWNQSIHYGERILHKRKECWHT